jgi:hypothetical protein
MNRREFIGGLAASALMRPRHLAAAPFPVKFRKPSPHEKLAPYILPGNDDFPEEKAAMELAARLQSERGSPHFVLPDGTVRYERTSGLEYRVGYARLHPEFRVVSETLAKAPKLRIVS